MIRAASGAGEMPIETGEHEIVAAIDATFRTPLALSCRSSHRHSVSRGRPYVPHRGCHLGIDGTQWRSLNLRV
jgi:hypothetical protein